MVKTGHFEMAIAVTIQYSHHGENKRRIEMQLLVNYNLIFTCELLSGTIFKSAECTVFFRMNERLIE